ncbi:MAG: cytochrome c [Gammaproteobacteria bacterium]|nr:cytochrome c [Gammaproteobacteria bacterium]
MTLPVISAADNSISSLRQQELKNLLIQDCGSCHGLLMKGGLGPALLPENLRGKPAWYITKTILEGRPGTAMPAWGPLLSEKEAEWITTLLLEKP